MALFSRRLLLGAGVSVLLATPAVAQGGGPSERFTVLLMRYVALHPDGVNRVDYARWKASSADLAELDAVIAAYTRLTPSRMTRDEQFAHWANLYNAITLQVVLARYPVPSIRNIRSEGVIDPRGLLGPWRTKRVTVEGRRLSLDDVEHRILRPQMRDARVHYAVNCASIGCPNLQPRAWDAATLDADLDAAARAFVNHPRAVAIRRDGSLQVSSIYVWFKEDFGGDDAGVIAHFRRYAAPALAAPLAAATRLGSNTYDWSLNAP